MFSDGSMEYHIVEPVLVDWTRIFPSHKVCTDADEGIYPLTSSITSQMSTWLFAGWFHPRRRTLPLVLLHDSRV